MEIVQEIILYFFIIPILSILIYAVVKSYIEEKNKFKNQIWNLKKAFRNQNERYEKQEYLIKIKSVNAHTKATFTTST